VLLRTPVQRLLHAAVASSEDGQLDAAVEGMREALEHEFDARVASAIHRIEFALERGEDVDLRELLAPVLEEVDDVEPSGVETTPEQDAEEFTIDLESDLFDDPPSVRSRASTPHALESHVHDPFDISDFDLGPSLGALRAEEVQVEEVSMAEFARAVSTDPSRSAPPLASSSHEVDPTPSAGTSSHPGDRSARARYQGTAPPPPSHRRGASSAPTMEGTPISEADVPVEPDENERTHDVVEDEPRGGDTLQGPNPLHGLFAADGAPEEDPFDPSGATGFTSSHDSDHAGDADPSSHSPEPSVPHGRPATTGWTNEASLRRRASVAASTRTTVARSEALASPADDPFAWAEEPYRRDDFRPPVDVASRQMVVTETEGPTGVERLDATLEVAPFRATGSETEVDRRGPSTASASPDTVGVASTQVDVVPSPPVEDEEARRQRWLKESRAARDRGDLAIALRLAEDALAADPSDPDVLSHIQGLKRQFLRIRMAQLEPLSRVPVLNYGVVATSKESLNQRLVYLFPLVDGMTSLQDIIDISGLSTADAVDALVQLVELRLLTFSD
jgi:hypothetical protein